MNFSELIKYIVPALGAIIGFLFLRLKSAQKSQATAETKSASAQYAATAALEDKTLNETRDNANALVDDYKRYSSGNKPGSDTK